MASIDYLTTNYLSLAVGSSSQNGTESDRRAVQCVSRHAPSFLSFCIFPGLAILINVVVLVAVLRKAKKLTRQSHVYAHVSSTLLGNLLFSLLSLLQILSLYLNFGGYPDDPDPSKRAVVHENSSRWWTILKSFLCGMFVIMSGNIGLLIDSIRHNTCSTLRTAAGHRLQKKDKRTRRRWKKRWLTRRHRSYLLISFLWVVPLVFIFAPVGEWNCVKTCQCLSECFPFNHGYKPSDYSCSRIFPPMANSWLSLVVLSWIIEILATLWLLKRSVQKITNTWVQASSLKCEKQRADGSYKTADLNSIRDGVSPGNLSQLSEECKFAKSNGLNLDCSCSENSLCSDIGVDKFVNKNDLNIKKCREENFENEDNKGISSEQKFCEASNSEIRQTFTKITEEPTKITMKCKETTTHRRMMKHLRNTRTSTFNLRFVIWLTVSFILCTTPTMVLLAIDILTPNLKLNMIVLNLCLMCPFVYCYTCPYILVKCLPGVKKSLSALVLSIYSTTD